MLPRRIKDKPTRPEGRIRSPSHLAWVREHECCIGNEMCNSPIQAAHVRASMDGGTGLKPGDDWAISLCHFHHCIQHSIGEPEFERLYGIDMKALAQEFAAKSPKLKKRRKVA